MLQTRKKAAPGDDYAYDFPGKKFEQKASMLTRAARASGSSNFFCRSGYVFTKYGCRTCSVTKNAAISGHNVERLTAQTTTTCKKLCLDRDWCKSFDWHKKTNKCDLSDKCAADVGGLKTDYSGNPYDHYACKCGAASSTSSSNPWLGAAVHYYNQQYQKQG